MKRRALLFVFFGFLSITVFYIAFSDGEAKLAEAQSVLSSPAIKNITRPSTGEHRPVFPLHTEGPHIVDADGHTMRLNCIGWPKSEEIGAPGGLHARHIDWLIKTVSDAGFNCVRLVFSLELILDNPARVVGDAHKILAANPELLEKSPLEILDITVEKLSQAGLIVVLNIHTLSFISCCKMDEGDSLWYSTHHDGAPRKTYTEMQFFEGVRRVARRYKHNPFVAGFDLKNEPRPSVSSTHYTTPTWGGGDPLTDWYLAARHASLLVREENEDMLIIVSGMNFGQYLCDVPKRPLHLDPSLQGKIIYETHNYVWFTIPFVAQKFVKTHGGVFAFWNAVYTVAVSSVFLVWLMLNRSRAESKGSSFANGWPMISERAVATSFSWIAGLSCLVRYLLMNYGCGLFGEIWKLSMEAVSFLFIGWSIFLWIRIVVTGALEKSNTGTTLRRMFSSWLLAALVFQAVELALIAHIRINFATYSRYVRAMDHNWGFLGSCSSRHPARIAPVWIGEFGQKSRRPEDMVDMDGLWWSYILRYFKERSFAGFAYWSLTSGSMAMLTDNGKEGLVIRRNGWVETTLKPIQELMKLGTSQDQC